MEHEHFKGKQKQNVKKAFKIIYESPLVIWSAGVLTNNHMKHAVENVGLKRNGRSF